MIIGRFKMSNWAIGCNVLGRLPGETISITSDADEAKRMLIHELKFAEDHTESEGVAEEYSLAAEDVNLMSVPLAIVVNGIVYWAQEIGEDEDE